MGVTVIPDGFQTRTYGKWILAGEHTVIRGGRALVFPLKSQYLDWNFTPDNSGALEVVIPKGYPEEFKLLFWSVFEKACQIKNISLNQFSGRLEIKAEILIGSGLGASATLCAALTRWFAQLGLISQADMFTFAKTLEDTFHGESSGVDVAVVLSESGLIFQRDQESQTFQATWQPEWYLSHCGERGITKECVQKVKILGERDPQGFARLDEQMKTAVQFCEEALTLGSSSGFSTLKEALDLARNCFQEWSLITPALEQHMKQLRSLGARAVKPTGSGGGGFVLSLWEEPPQDTSNITFLKASVR